MKIWRILLLSCVWLYSLELDALREQLSYSQIQGNFTQEKRIQNLPHSIKTTGYFSITKKTLLWETKTPIPSSVKITNEGIYTLENGQWHPMGNSYSKQFFLSLINLDFAELQKNFQLLPQGNLEQWQIQLQPTGAIIRKFFKEIYIRGNHLVKEVVLEEANGDITTIRFDNMQTK